MYVPAGRTVQLQLFVSPKDVIHAFYVPQFLFKRDIVPGRTTAFDFTVDAADAGRIPRPVRRAVRRAPQHDAVRRQGLDRPRIRRVAGRQGRQGECDAAHRPRAAAGGSGGPGGPGETLKIARPEHRLRADQPHGQGGERRSRSSSTTRTTVFRITSRSTGLLDRDRDLQGRDLPRCRRQRHMTWSQLDAGTYAFVCSVHPTMTGTLTVQ